MDLTGVKCAVCFADVDRDWEVIADEIVCVKCVGVWTDEELEERFQEQRAWHRSQE